jgi:junctophilin
MLRETYTTATSPTAATFSPAAAAAASGSGFDGGGNEGDRVDGDGGRHDFDDGGTYCGSWSDGRANGHGVCTGPHGQGEYAGAWNYGFETSGTYTWPNGHVYAGEWSDGRRQGVGTETHGRWIYRGEWTAGLKGRYGIRHSTVSGARYEGTWVGGLQDGFGVETYADQSTYQGQWMRGQRHGYGIRQSAPFDAASLTRLHDESQLSRPDRGQQLPQQPPPSPQPDHHHNSLPVLNSIGPPSVERGRSLERGRAGFALTGNRANVANDDGRTTPSSAAATGHDEAPRRRSRSASLRRTIADGLGRIGRRKKRHEMSTGDLTSATVTTQTLQVPRDVSPVSPPGGCNNVNSLTPSGDLIETYMGEWKADKRCGYGISQRSDGLRYSGEWYNDKKCGYGATYFPDRRADEQGKYKDNDLVTDITGTTRKFFAIRPSKMRERVNAAVTQARKAAEIAALKADVAASRRTTAKVKAELAERAAQIATENAQLAKVVAKRYEQAAAVAATAAAAIAAASAAATAVENSSSATDLKPDGHRQPEVVQPARLPSGESGTSSIDSGGDIVFRPSGQQKPPPQDVYLPPGQPRMFHAIGGSGDPDRRNDRKWSLSRQQATMRPASPRNVDETTTTSSSSPETARESKKQQVIARNETGDVTGGPSRTALAAAAHSGSDRAARTTHGVSDRPAALNDRHMAVASEVMSRWNECVTADGRRRRAEATTSGAAAAAAASSSQSSPRRHSDDVVDASTSADRPPPAAEVAIDVRRLDNVPSSVPPTESTSRRSAARRTEAETARRLHRDLSSEISRYIDDDVDAAATAAAAASVLDDFPYRPSKAVEQKQQQQQQQRQLLDRTAVTDAASRTQQQQPFRTSDRAPVDSDERTHYRGSRSSRSTSSQALETDLDSFIATPAATTAVHSQRLNPSMPSTTTFRNVNSTTLSSTSGGGDGGVAASTGSGLLDGVVGSGPSRRLTMPTVIHYRVHQPRQQPVQVRGPAAAAGEQGGGVGDQGAVGVPASTGGGGVSPRRDRPASAIYMLSDGIRRRLVPEEQTSTADRAHVHPVRCDPTAVELATLPRRYRLVPAGPSAVQTPYAMLGSAAFGVPPAHSVPNVNQIAGRAAASDGSSAATVTGVQIMKREEVAVLSQQRRDEIRRLKEQAERDVFVLSLADIKEWCQGHELVLFFLALNLALAAIFYRLMAPDRQPPQ